MLWNHLHFRRCIVLISVSDFRELLKVGFESFNSLWLHRGLTRLGPYLDLMLDYSYLNEFGKICSV